MADKSGIGTLINDAIELGTNSLDLFTLPPYERLLVHGKTVYFNLKNALTNDGPFEFELPADNNDYTSLPFTTLEGCVEIQKLDGTALTATEKTSVVNLFPHSLFRQCEVYLNDILVSDISSPTYALKAFIETHLSAKKALKDTVLKDAEWYYKDSVGKEETLDLATASDPFTVRFNRIKDAGGKVYFSFTPHIDLLKCERLLIPNCTLRFKFLRNEDTYSLFSSEAGAAQAKIVFKELKMHCRRITVDPHAAKAIETKNLTTPVIYPLTSGKIKKLLLNTGTQSINLSSVLRGPQPRQLIVGFCSAKGGDGHLTKTPFLFKNFKNKYFNATISGEPIVPKVFQPDCSNKHVMREYKWFLDNIGCYDHVSVDITLEDFLSNTFLYAFDFSPDLCNNFYLHGTENGTLDFDIVFETALTENIHCIVYAAFNEYLLIDGEKNVKIVPA